VTLTFGRGEDFLMSRLLVIAALVTAVAFGRSSAAEPDLDKLLAKCVDTTALVFGPDRTKEPAPVAGALVLDLDKRLVLAQSTNVPDATNVLFPAYADKGELRNQLTDYAGRSTVGKEWVGKVLYRDKKRDLVVIRLDRALPARARPAMFSAGSAPFASTIRALCQPATDGDKVWGLAEGTVRTVSDEPIWFGFGRPANWAAPMQVVATAQRGKGLDFGLVSESGDVLGYSSRPGSDGARVFFWMDVTELRAFLSENGVSFQTAPDRSKAGDTKRK
jgi:hypothetical protein